METGCSGTQMSRAGYIVVGVTLTCTTANNKTHKTNRNQFQKKGKHQKSQRWKHHKNITSIPPGRRYCCCVLGSVVSVLSSLFFPHLLIWSALSCFFFFCYLPLWPLMINTEQLSGQASSNLQFTTVTTWWPQLVTVSKKQHDVLKSKIQFIIKHQHMYLFFSMSKLWLGWKHRRQKHCW